MKRLVAIMAILAASIVDAVAANSDLFSVGKMQLGGASKCERCIRRCEREVCGTPLPSPSPTASPTPGKPCDYELRTSRTITFVAGDEPITICHTPPSGSSSPFIELQSINGGNANCADFWLQMYSPNGATSEPSRGSAPGAVMQRVPGRYVISAYLREASNAACSTLTFTVR